MAPKQENPWLIQVDGAFHFFSSSCNSVRKSHTTEGNLTFPHVWTFLPQIFKFLLNCLSIFCRVLSLQLTYASCCCAGSSASSRRSSSTSSKTWWKKPRPQAARKTAEPWVCGRCTGTHSRSRCLHWNTQIDGKMMIYDRFFKKKGHIHFCKHQKT